MASRRSKSISTKVTPDEYARLAGLVGDQTVSEWARAVLLRAAEPDSLELLLAELLALRTILLNLHFALCRGEPVTAETMQRFIQRADDNKRHEAADRLQTTATRRAR
jgi:hypothetical protein